MLTTGNEPESVKLAFTWTADEFKAAYKDYSAGRIRTVVRSVFLMLFVIALLLYLVLISLNKGLSFETGMYGICLALLGGVAVFLSPWFQTRQFLRYRSSLCGKLLQWEVKPTELKYSMSDGTGANMLWDTITSVRKGKRGFLLYITPSMFHWLPYHAFGCIGDIDRFEKIVQSNVKKFRKGM